MTTEKDDKDGIGRRDFLKRSAAIIAAGATVEPAVPLLANPIIPESPVHSVVVPQISSRLKQMLMALSGFNHRNTDDAITAGVFTPGVLQAGIANLGMAASKALEIAQHLSTSEADRIALKLLDRSDDAWSGYYTYTDLVFSKTEATPDTVEKTVARNIAEIIAKWFVRMPTVEKHAGESFADPCRLRLARSIIPETEWMDRLTKTVAGAIPKKLQADVWKVLAQRFPNDFKPAPNMTEQSEPEEQGAASSDEVLPCKDIMTTIAEGYGKAAENAFTEKERARKIADTNPKRE